VAFDVAVYLLHVVEVVVGVVRLVLLQETHDPAPRLVALGLALALPDGLGLVGLEPVLELLAGHVHGLFELVYRLLAVVVRHLCSS
jgi:hypothetical protein